MRRALVCGILFSASLGSTSCFKGNFENCTVTCNNDNECPSGLSCANGACTSGTSCLGAIGDAGVDADLTMPQRLTITKTGEGTITSAPAGINCGTECSALFEPRSTVTLTAPTDSTRVVDLTGACSTMRYSPTIVPGASAGSCGIRA